MYQGHRVQQVTQVHKSPVEKEEVILGGGIYCAIDEHFLNQYSLQGEE